MTALAIALILAGPAVWIGACVIHVRSTWSVEHDPWAAASNFLTYWLFGSSLFAAGLCLMGAFSLESALGFAVVFGIVGHLFRCFALDLLLPRLLKDYGRQSRPPDSAP